MDIQFINRMIESKIINIHTGYIAKILKIQGTSATVQPLTYSKDTRGNEVIYAPVKAIIPSNIKFKRQDINYLVSVNYSEGGGLTTKSEAATVLIPEELAVDDIVYCAVCERDITNALSGKSTVPTRKHDINDSIILKVL